MPVTSTRALRALLPGMVVLIAAIVAMVLLDDGTLAVVTGRYAPVLYGAGAILAVVFHRSRVVTCLLALGLLDLITRRAVPEETILVPLGSFLLALLGAMAVLRDRGIFSRGGLAQLGASTAAAYAWLRALGDSPDLDALLPVELLPPGISGSLGLPQATLVVGAVALLAAAYAAYRWRGPVELALLWAQLLVLLALHPSMSAPEASFLLMASGLVLSVSVLETSYVMAYRDDLTGLPARRALMRDLAQINGTYTLAMVDVDHFKKFNDKHGHDVGDQVLQLVAARLADAPGGGKAYRYGGEEFTLLFPGRVREDALPHLEAVRESVEDASFSLRAWNRPRKKPTKKKAASKAGKKKPKRKRRPRQLSVTVSIGASDSTAKDATPELVLKKADKALYRAKEDGRNQVSA